MKKNLSVKVMAEIGMMVAIGFALDAFQGGVWKGLFPNGGSIGLAMVPIFIIAFRRGLIPGVIAGLILSLIQMLSGIYVIQGASLSNEFLKVCGPFIQIFLDYVLGYTLVGFAGCFFKKYHTSDKNMKYIIIGCVLGGLLKFLSHFLAGVFFWPGEIFGVSGVGYSFIYNGLYCIPNIIICTIVMFLIAKYYPQFINVNEGEEE